MQGAAKRLRLRAMEGSTTIRHPNREKSSSQVTKPFIGLLLLVSAVLIAVITFGGWSALQGAQVVAVAYLLVYLIMAFFVMRWSRGVLPLVAALAVGLAVFGAIAAPAWFDRDKPNYAAPSIASGLLGTLAIVVVLVQIVLIVFALIGFAQKWNIEVEESPGGGDGQPSPATG
ncbi:MAG: hypothetical protein QOJ07_2088 [Thermoleophilaceae bacterium]|nr:hypothetical protein [Thermoleophilaceae bacterium]